MWLLYAGIEAPVRHIKAVAEAKPNALIGVLELLEMRNVVPRRIAAQRIPVRGCGTEILEIEIELTASDLASEVLQLIAAKIAALPMILTAVADETSNP